MTPKDVEKRLDQTLFLGKLRHSAPVLPHQGGGSILSWVLQVSLCLQDSHSPRSVFHCPAPGRLRPIPLPEFPVWGCWVTGAGSASLGNQPGWALLRDSHWDAASAGMPLGNTAASRKLPLPPADPQRWSWTLGSALGGLFSIVFPPLSALFITIIRLWVFDPHESIFQRCLRVFVQSH